jgi:hypothetical protein
VWDGQRWSWIDLRPLGESSYQNAISYEEFGVQQIRVFGSGFCQGAGCDLSAFAWDGASWTSFDLGRPDPGQSYPIPFAMSPVTYVDTDGTRQIRVFAEGLHVSFDRLIVDAWDGNGWRWFDLGRPATNTVVGSPSAITYNDGGFQQIRVFCVGDDGHLYANAWDGESWTWVDLGTPA